MMLELKDYGKPIKHIHGAISQFGNMSDIECTVTFKAISHNNLVIPGPLESNLRLMSRTDGCTYNIKLWREGPDCT